jgi:GNAT superfamily N-acetyltransferase
MTADDPSPGSNRTRVERVDDRLGLAVSRVGLSGRTLTTYARDHVSVRTPSRSDFWDGNTIDLLAPPAPSDLPRWIERFHDTIGIMGATHVQVRWEQPVASDAPAVTPTADPALVAAWTELGFDLAPTTILLLDDLSDPAPASAELAPIAAPSAVPGGAVDRRWHAATVLYRYARGDTPDDWRDVDQGFTDWAVDVQRELASAGRCQVWVAMRHGGPVGRLTLLHDRQGLAVVEDVIVHPVHRRIGIASALTHRAVSSYLDVAPGARVGIGADPGSGADHLYRRLGFRPHATVWTAVRLPG